MTVANEVTSTEQSPMEGWNVQLISEVRWRHPLGLINGIWERNTGEMRTAWDWASAPHLDGLMVRPDKGTMQPFQRWKHVSHEDQTKFQAKNNALSSEDSAMCDFLDTELLSIGTLNTAHYSQRKESLLSDIRHNSMHGLHWGEKLDIQEPNKILVELRYIDLC